MGCLMTGEKKISDSNEKKPNVSDVKTHNGIVTLIDGIKTIENKFGDEHDFEEIDTSKYFINPSDPEITQDSRIEFIDQSLTQHIHGDTEISNLSHKTIQDQKDQNSIFSKIVEFYHLKILKQKNQKFSRFGSDDVNHLQPVHATFTLRIDDYGKLVGLQPPRSPRVEKMQSLVSRFMKRWQKPNDEGKVDSGFRGTLNRFLSFLPFVNSSTENESKDMNFLDKMKRIIPWFNK
jgi:hypothetical protein